MKQLLILGLALLCFKFGYSQVKNDTSVVKYITTFHYISLSDSTHLPNEVKPYQSVLIGSLKNSSSLKALYIVPGSLQNDTYNLRFELNDVARIREILRLSQPKKLIKDTNFDGHVILRVEYPHKPDNPPGHSFFVTLNKISQQVTFKEQ